jgi:hypothetical protein
VRTVFIRAIDSSNKANAVLDAIQSNGGPIPRWELDPATFGGIPMSPFAYWGGPALIATFRRFGRLESQMLTARVGAQTSDDFRFLHAAWEIGRVPAGRSWMPIAKGGAYSRYYSSMHLLLNWADDGHELKAWAGSLYSQSHWSRILKNTQLFGSPGLTWSRRSQLGLSLRVLPAGAAFADKGPAVFAPGRSLIHLAAILAIANSRSFRALVDLQMAFGSYEVGVIQRTPVPDLTPADEAALAGLARRAWSLKRSLDTRIETSHAFVLPAPLQMEGRALAARSAAWTEHVERIEAELASIQTEIDERCFELYGIDDEDRRAITEGFGASSPDAEAAEDGTDADADDEADAEAAADTATLAAELVSWAVGVAVGRFDIRLATGDREVPVEPEPFDPLPVCSPAMLTGDDGLPVARPPAGYPLSFPDDGIVVDDQGHPRDLTTAVRAAFDTVFGASADEIWQETAALLDPKGHDVRTWLARDFFGHHLARYSKSRRKAPILWQLGPASARYSTWCYAHRLTRDSLFALARDVVAPKLALEERRQAGLVGEAGPNPTAKQRAEIAGQDAVVAELRAFAEEVHRVAPLWNPDLDDGIVLVEAPLWRLVPHKPWQKELKSRWDDLVAGKYDWAHTAMHLWPERVVPKCATDRSLAIAHGLEDVFWVEGADGKWTKRATPTRSIDDLVAERASPAVKAALADLLGAPALAAGARGRGE